MGSLIELEVDDGSRMLAYAAQPAAWGERGVIVLQEAFGVNAHIRSVAERLVQLGYRTIAPELYHRTAPGFEGDYENIASAMPHMQALSGDALDADLRAAHAFLRQGGVKQVAAVGFCLGGRVAIRAGATLPLYAVASFYGGFPKEQVARLNAPLLLVWGDQDTHFPPAQRGEFNDLLRAEGKSFVECTFSDAGHGFFCEERAAYRAHAARVAWAGLVEFLAAER
ncbi:MAG: dienelactone hydrolase family protein, partial [Terriglobales bacterium]